MSVQDLNARFQYKSDTEQHKLQEKWTVLRNPTGPLVGDCEDYALTALWLIEGKNDSAFHHSLQTGQAKIWFCYTPSGEAHAVLEYNGLMIDNIQKDWKSKEAFEGFGYDFKYAFTHKEVTWRLKAGEANRSPKLAMMLTAIKEDDKNPLMFIGIAVAIGAIIWLIT